MSADRTNLMHDQPAMQGGGEGSWSMIDLASRLLQEQRIKGKIFGHEWAHTPAVNILLGIYVSQCIDIPFGIKNAAELADCSERTASRWVSALESSGLVQISPAEGLTIATLTASTSAQVKLLSFFEELGAH